MGAPPLADLRVIELGQLVAGPFCGQLLADFGAEVIKVEAPDRPDPARQWGAATVNGRGLLWPVIGRNKKSLTLNLREAAGQELLLQLVGGIDVLIENFRPGTLERWNLGPERLMALNPRLIMVRISGFGQTGPDSHKAGYASVCEARAGLRHLTGDPDRPPARAAVSLGDTLTGTFAALGAMMALRARERTGRGQIVDAAIYESVLALMEGLIPEFALAGHVRERNGSVMPRVAPSNIYPCRDGWVVIGANQDTTFGRLATMCGAAWDRDPRFSSHAARADHQAELDQCISEWTGTRGLADITRLADDHGVPCGPVCTARDLLADAHLAARDAITRVIDPVLGEVPMQNVFPQLSDTPGRVHSTGPELGADTDEVLGALGLSLAQLSELRERGII